MQKETAMVYFVGAGPGDPELLTVKAARLIAAADIIIYAGSLVNPQVLGGAKKTAVLYNSAELTLEEIIGIIGQGIAEKKNVVRLHTGDPALYGAIREQMDTLEKKGIPFVQVPGVSSFSAAAAALKREYTLPGVSQTVILTRQEGRTKVPAAESIGALAAHQATMVIFLSTHKLDSLVAELKNGYREDTPVAVVYKASWPEEMIIKGTLADIAEKVQQAGITKTALVIVGRCLAGEYALSQLYDKHFSHEYRSARP